MASFSLLKHDPAALIALREGRTVSAGEFIAAARAVAAALPAQRYAINVCVDRYSFALGFAAALLRGQTTLMPPGHAPDVIERLRCGYPDSYCLTDGIVRQTGPAHAAPADCPSLDADHPAAVLFTSGSTGAPQPQAKSWGMLVRSADAELERFAALAPAGMAVLGTVPPQHMYGLESTVMMCFRGALLMYCGKPFFPAEICEQLAALPRPRALVTTPVHLRALLEGMDEVPPLDFILCATAPLAPQLAAQAERRFRAPLHEIYGCTEAGQVATRRTTRTPEWAPYGHFRLRQDEKGTWLHDPGRSPDLLLADVIELRAGDRFLLHGRTGDLVNIAGKRTSLAALNYHLNCIPGVQDGIFIVPEESVGPVTRLTALAVAPECSEEQILHELRQRIDPAFLPRRVRIIASLPRNDVGKLPRAALTALHEAPEPKAG